MVSDFERRYGLWQKVRVNSCGVLIGKVCQTMQDGEVLVPLFAFLADDRPFAEVSRLAVVSKTWRRVSLNALKTTVRLILRGFVS